MLLAVHTPIGDVGLAMYLGDVIEGCSVDPRLNHQQLKQEFSLTALHIQEVPPQKQLIFEKAHRH